MSKKKGLGKGLGALLGTSEETDVANVIDIDINKIKANPYQPRSSFNDESLESLTESIRKHGVIQPIIVKDLGDGYEIIAGERRYRANRLAGNTTIPSIIRKESIESSAIIAFIENLQREDLNPVEEALGFNRLIKDFGYTQKDLSIKIGKSRSFIANSVRLLTLDRKILDYLISGKISSGHARALLMLDESKRLNIADSIIEKGLTVRQVESMSKERKPNIRKRDIHLDDFSSKLTELIGSKASISKFGDKYTLKIDFFDINEVDEFYKKIKR